MGKAKQERRSFLYVIPNARLGRKGVGKVSDTNEIRNKQAGVMDQLLTPGRVGDGGELLDTDGSPVKEIVDTGDGDEK